MCTDDISTDPNEISVEVTATTLETDTIDTVSIASNTKNHTSFKNNILNRIYQTFT